MEVRVLGDLALYGAMVYEKDSADFPANPRVGMFAMKDGCLYGYLRVGGLETWYPFSSKTRSYVHSQGVAGYIWTVHHNLGTRNVWIQVKDNSGNILNTGKQDLDDNTFEVYFTTPTLGTVMVVAPDSVEVPTVKASVLDVGNVHIDTSGVYVNGQVVLTDANIASQIATAVAGKANSASLATVATTGSYNDLLNKPVVAPLGGSTTQDFAVKALTVNGDILPAVNGVSNIGSPTQKFAAVYTKEMHIDANTLYVDGVPVIGSSANTIQISADVNQGIRIATTGSGTTTLDSAATTTIKTNGQNADVLIQAGGQGSLARLTSATQVVLTAPVVNTVGDAVMSGNLLVNGNMTVKGAVSTIESTVTTIKDNVITLNKGEAGSGVSLRYSGIDIDRGDLARQRIVWDETTGKWVAGVVGAESALATEGFVGAALATKADAGSLSAVAASGNFADLLNKPTTLAGYGVSMVSGGTF